MSRKSKPRTARTAKSAEVLPRMRAIAEQYPRWGYRRIRVMLAREGLTMSAGRAYPIWRRAQLQVPKKRARRRIAGSRPRPIPAACPNQVWAYDFVFDACANGQKLKCLTVVDEWTHEALAIDVGGSIRSSRVIEVLSRLVSVRGAPRVIRSDNGPELVSLAVLGSLAREGIETGFIAPGKPWQNGLNESFNGKFRDECLPVELSWEWFRSRREAAILIEAWRKHYNEERPHSSLNYLKPAEFRRGITTPLKKSAAAGSVR